MHFFKRALLGITRPIGKTFILLAIIFILGNVISGAIAIQQATNNAENQIKERLGTATKIVADHEEIDKLGREEIEKQQIQLESIDIDLIHQIGEMPYVKYYDYNTYGSFKSEQIDYYTSDAMKEQIEQGYDYHNPTFNLKGVNYAPVIDLEEGESELIDGRTFTEEEIKNGAYVAIITQSVAEINNLRVGDTFTLLNEVMETMASSDEERGLLDAWDVDLEVIGVFDPQSNMEDFFEEYDEMMAIFQENDLENTMYLPNDTLLSEFDLVLEVRKALDEHFDHMMAEQLNDYYFPEYFLHHVDDAEAFRQEVTPLLPDFHKVVMATDEYEKVAGPVESMSKLAQYVLYATIGTTVFITGLIVLLFLRDRKHELGIYLSLGERRVRVISQIVLEVMIIAVIGITLSLFTGNMLAKEISETMVQLDETEDTVSGGAEYIYFQSSISEGDVIGAYDIQFDAVYVIVFYGIALLTILLSTVIPLIYIVRLNPKKILM